MMQHIVARPRCKTAVAGARGLSVALILLGLTGCQSVGSAGPSTARVVAAAAKPKAGTAIQIISVDLPLVQRVKSSQAALQFSSLLRDDPAGASLIGPGDVIDIALWEAPPAVLFGSTGYDTRSVGGLPLAQGGNLLQQEVGVDGHITVPFIGPLRVVGRTTGDVAQEIVRRLASKAHAPQAIVRLVRNETRTVTIVGEVSASLRMPLTPRGERLLDAIAAAGGVKQPVGKTTVQISRSGQVAAMPLEAIIRDPAQNVRLQPDDVVTALYQPYSFIALGATSAQAEIPFEGGGISLAQAMGRVGGLRDERADVRGVFIFRMEDANALGMANTAQLAASADGKIPVIYRIDLRDPAGLFIARDFMIRDKDIVYVSNAPLADLQKFVNIVSSLTYSIVNLGNAVR